MDTMQKTVPIQTELIQIQTEMQTIQMETQPVGIEIQAPTTTAGNFKESVTIVVQRVTKRLIVGRKKRMLISAQRIGSREKQELNSMQAVWNNFGHASKLKKILFSNFVAG